MKTLDQAIKSLQPDITRLNVLNSRLIEMGNEGKSVYDSVQEKAYYKNLKALTRAIEMINFIYDAQVRLVFNDNDHVSIKY